MCRKSFLLKYTVFLLAVHLWYLAVFAAAADEAEQRQVYIIGPGDRLLITIVGYEKDLATSVIVRPDGMITYPVVGDIQAAGLTVDKLSSSISEQLSVLGYYEDPRVTVQLTASSQDFIYVIGDVEEPGQKAFLGSVNVVEALASAGGFKETADLANARIIKERKEIVPVDLERLLKTDIIDRGVASDQLSSDKLMLKNGDILIIPSIIKEEQVSIIGHVRAPGRYQVRSSISLIDALALAGGPLEETADLRHIRIIKPVGSVVIVDATRAWAEAGIEKLPSNLHPQHNESGTVTIHQDIVQPGDSVVILEKEVVNILGRVKTQGQFSVDGEISIVEALTLAGIDEGSNLKKLRIARSTGEWVIVDASRIWKQECQEFEEKLHPGDTLIVPRSRGINWSAVSAVVLIISTLYAMFK